MSEFAPTPKIARLLTEESVARFGEAFLDHSGAQVTLEPVAFSGLDYIRAESMAEAFPDIDLSRGQPAEEELDAQIRFLAADDDNRLPRLGEAEVVTIDYIDARMNKYTLERNVWLKIDDPGDHRVPGNYRLMYELNKFRSLMGLGPVIRPRVGHGPRIRLHLGTVETDMGVRALSRICARVKNDVSPVTLGPVQAVHG